ncbi:19179_t:CDS:2, partial [Racocetra persica]
FSPYRSLETRYNNLVDRFNELSRSSVNKDGAERILNNSKENYNKLWNEYSKNIDDYNKLLKNTVSKEAFERLETEYKKNISDYNKLVGEHRELAEKCRNLIERLGEYEEYREKYENIRDGRENERVDNARTRATLEERLESSNARIVDLTRRLENSENQLTRLEIRSDEKSVAIQNLNSQLANLRLESGEKDSRLREKDSELARKNDEIERLKNQAKSSDKRAEKTQEELLTEKIRSKKRNLELFATELRVGLEQINGLTRYHERLFRARKNYNQANIETHENNIMRIKEELQNADISIVNIQELCEKCERIAELRVSETATQEEIKIAYRKLALKWHPDKFATKSLEEKEEANKKMQEINKAYEVLGSEELRKSAIETIEEAMAEKGLKIEDLGEYSNYKELINNLDRQWKIRNLKDKIV